MLAKRSDQIAGLVVNTNALLGELLSQRDSVDALMINLRAAGQQISGLVADNRTQLKPAVDKLNGVLEILDNRKQELQRTLYLLRRYAMSFGEVLGSGPFFKASLVNLAPGQFSQPFIDAAFSDLGLDPNVLLPSELVDPGRRPARHPGAADAVPANRPGRRAASDPARRDHRQPRRSDAPPACRCPAPAAIPTASRCPLRRRVVRRRGRPPSAPEHRRRPSGRRSGARTGGSDHPTSPAPVGHRAGGDADVILAVAITVVATPWWDRVSRDTFTAYFANANGLYTGDEVRILGVAVGTVDEIDPQPNTKVTFSVDSEYPVPADAKAAILSPSLVSARAIQLVPAYSGGPKLRTGRAIPQDRTAVPVEWDDFRKQLEKLTDSLQPTDAGRSERGGGVRQHRCGQPAGQGDTARDTVIKLSQAISALGDHSTDIFSTVRNLQLLVSALSSSSDLLAAFNTNLADSDHAVGQHARRVRQRHQGLSTAR